MDAAGLPKISADCHVNEPHDLWYTRLNEDMREKAPHHIQSLKDGGWKLVVNGDNVGTGSKATHQQKTGRDRIDADRDEEIRIEARLAMMAEDGINGEIIFPTIGLYSYRVEDPAVGEASCLLYNDWIFERMSGCPRIKLTPLIPTWDVSSAIREVERWADHPDVGGMFLPLVTKPEWNHPQWEPLWDAIEQTGKPVVMHQSTGHAFPYTSRGAPIANMTYMQSMGPRTCALLASSGVLAGHTGLHFALVEVNAGWMAELMHSIDDWTVALEPNYGKNLPKFDDRPSNYLRRQVHATFMDDPIAILNREYTGLDCLMWGNDFPHLEGTFPKSNQVINSIMGEMPENEVRQIVADNALQVFGFSPTILESSVERPNAAA